MNLSPKKTEIGSRICYSFECDELQEELRKQVEKIEDFKETEEYVYYPAMIVYKNKTKKNGDR